jgi:hypothetical protein
VSETTVEWRPTRKAVRWQLLIVLGSGLGVVSMVARATGHPGRSFLTVLAIVAVVAWLGAATIGAVEIRRRQVRLTADALVVFGLKTHTYRYSNIVRVDVDRFAFGAIKLTLTDGSVVTLPCPTTHAGGSTWDEVRAAAGELRSRLPQHPGPSPLA